MPWKDPEIHSIVIAAILALITSLLRSLYDGKHSLLKCAIESVLIGFVTIGIGMGLKALGADGNWVYFAGSTVGLLGIDFIRYISKEEITRRVK